MKANKVSFSPSVNIIRDSDKELNYVVTKNSVKVASQILSDFRNQIHSFSIIGSYGTGKSSFLWAFEKNLKKEKDFFFNLNGEFEKVRFINIVGSYSPIEEILHKVLRLRTEPTTINVLEGLNRVYAKSKKAGELLVIVIDEFGKILEYASQHNPEERMFFIQQIAEFVNNPTNNIILINTLHQNFNAYASRLRPEQKQEWNKVRGRFVELTFNEPVEQLLFLAADQIKQWNIFGIERLNNKEKNQAILDSGLLPISNEFAKKLFFNLLPMDMLSASILSQVLKDYGQNERSLFTFLAMRNEDSLYAHAEGLKSFDIVTLYDYVINNFYSQIDDKHNRDKNKWDRIKISIDRIHTHFEEYSDLATIIIKSIGLLSIYGNKGGKLDASFLEGYLGDGKIIDVLSKLEELKIIIYRKHLSSYTITEGTDLDYYEAIENASTKIDTSIYLADHLRKYYTLPYLNAKEVSYEVGTPRFFEFSITDELLDESATGEIDGRIYLIFNPKITQQDILAFTKSVQNANIYVRYKNTTELSNVILELRKVEYVLERIENDRVAEDELKKIHESLRNQLNNEILDEIYASSRNTEWYYIGKRQNISSQRSINKLLSKVVKHTYYLTPTIKNELINKHKISSAISTARKNYIKALLNHWHLEYLGFESNKFPPEKTIYETLLKNTGLHGKLEGDFYGFTNEAKPSLKHLWNISESFLHESMKEQKAILELIEILKAPPYKLKDGLINFWIPTFLIIRNDEYALFKDGNYIPFLTADLFDLVYRNPKAFTIRAYPFGGIEISVFNKYRDLFNIPSGKEITNQSIIETIKPFLVFYKELPEFAKQTEHLSPSTKSFRNAIASAKDPYTAFFETFPESLGFKDLKLNATNDLLDSYVIALKKAINELRLAYNELLKRFELYLQKLTTLSEPDGISLKRALEHRFMNIDIDRISQVHKKVLSWIRVPIDDMQRWTEAAAMAILDKPLREVSDDEEELLYKTLRSIYQDLIDLIPLYEKKNSLSNLNEKILGVKLIHDDGQSKGFQAIVNGDSHLSEELYRLMMDKTVGLKDHEKRAVAIELINHIIDEQNRS